MGASAGIKENSQEGLTISDYYREQNAGLHAARADYGRHGHKWADQITALYRKLGCSNMLDYGSGKGSLKDALPRDFTVAEYDPAIPGKDGTPEPADLVVCIDVLEHIEPEYLDAVLDDLVRCAKIAVYLVADCKPAKKFLPDGRNAHLIVELPSWWLERLEKRFETLAFSGNAQGLAYIGKPR